MLQRETYGGVQIARTPLWANHSTSLVPRLGNYLSFDASASLGALRVLRSSDVSYVFCTPATAASDTETDNHFVPAVHLEGPNADLLAFLGTHSGVTATWAAGQPATVRGDVMAGFSSRGPLGDFLKPDITAPGVQILAGHTPTPLTYNGGPEGELFQAIAGTSMSSPHLAGASALVKAAHPTWTPGQIKSALMTSSTQDVLKEDGVTPADPFDRGAGSMRVDAAVAAVATISETPENLYGIAAMDRVDLNLPSIQASPLPGAITTQRTLTNTTTRDQPFKASATGAKGLKVSVSPSSFSVPAGGTRTITITIDGTAAPDGWAFGQVTLTSTNRKAPSLVLPVTARVADSVVPMTHTCEPTDLARNQDAACTVTLTNNSAAPAPVKLSLAAPSRVDISSVSAPGHRHLERVHLERHAHTRPAADHHLGIGAVSPARRERWSLCRV